MSISLNAFDYIYIGSPAIPPLPLVPGAAPVVGPNLIFPPAKAVFQNLLLLIEYTPGTIGNTLTVGWEVGENLLAPPGFQYYPVFGATPVGPLVSVASPSFFAIVTSMPGGPSLIRYNFASAGPPAPLDSLRVVIAGLPTGMAIAP